jgi:GT2 family glycosyltransferase
MDATIILCTHDRAALLERALASLAATVAPVGVNMETVVVANACRDATAQVVRSWQDRGVISNLRLLEEPRLGKSHALNRGVAEAAGDLLIFVDDDHRVARDWLATVLAAAQAAPEIPCFCGRIVPDWDGSEPSWVHDQGEYRIRPFPVPNFDLGPEPCDVALQGFLPGGGNLFFRKTVLRTVGGFDLHLGPRGHDLGGGEDVAFVVRVLRAGLPIRYIPGALQYHYVDPQRLTWRYIVRKGYQRSRDLRCSTPAPPGRQLAGVPAYLVPQLLRQLWRVAATLDTERRRHFLVRSAATCGEIAGYRQARRAVRAEGTRQAIEGRRR